LAEKLREIVMKKTLLFAAAAATLALTAPAASAQTGWQPINVRQANLEHRIDVGVRNGSLTRNEAYQLRSEFNAIARLEAHYRRNGLSRAEMADLDRRFDALSQRVRYERHDRQDRRDTWQNINQRQRALDARIDAGVRDGSLSRREAVRLRAEFHEIAELEARYRRNGLSWEERRDLDRRFDRLSAQVRAERQDWNNRRS
jgi:Skp family chaperone for outer membrane proteins